MERIGVRELNQHTSRVLARVRSGETIVVTERGRPVARIVPVGSALAVLDRMVAESRAVPPSASGLAVPPVVGPPDRDVAAELAASRDEERW